MKVLIIAPASYQHLLAARALFWQLKSQGHQLDLVAPSSSHWLVKYLPEFDNQLCLPFSSQDLVLSQRFQLSSMLREQHYERAVVLDESWLSAMLAMLAFIPWRTGWRGSMRFFLLNDIRLPPRISENYTYVQAYVDLVRDSKQVVKGGAKTLSDLPPIAATDLKLSSDQDVDPKQALKSSLGFEQFPDDKAFDLLINMASVGDIAQWLQAQPWLLSLDGAKCCIIQRGQYSQAQWQSLQAQFPQLTLVSWDTEGTDLSQQDISEQQLLLINICHRVVTSDISLALLATACNALICYIGQEPLHNWLSCSEPKAFSSGGSEQAPAAFQ